MDLKLKDEAKLLKVSEKTIYRWVKSEKIPYYRINHQYRFKEQDILQWSNKSAANETSSANKKLSPIKEYTKATIYNSIQNGGIYYQIEGETMKNVLQESVNLINIPSDIEKEELINLLYEREEMSPTAIGNGIAFPHPRNPIVPIDGFDSIAICFLETPLKGIAMDQEPIHTLFIILSSNQERHLKLLSKLSFFCRDTQFLELLKKRTKRSEILNFIKSREKDIK